MKITDDWPEEFFIVNKSPLLVAHWPFRWLSYVVLPIGASSSGWVRYLWGDNYPSASALRQK